MQKMEASIALYLRSFLSLANNFEGRIMSFEVLAYPSFPEIGYYSLSIPPIYINMSSLWTLFRVVVLGDKSGFYKLLCILADPLTVIAVQPMCSVGSAQIASGTGMRHATRLMVDTGILERKFFALQAIAVLCLTYGRQTWVAILTWSSKNRELKKRMRVHPATQRGNRLR